MPHSFSNPLHVVEQNGRVRRQLSDVETAARWLLEKWPGPDTAKAKAARRACLAALEGQASADAARKAVYAVLRERGIEAGA